MNSKLLKNSLTLCLTTACLLVASSQKSHASSYAVNLTNNAGLVSFRLNDAADSVKVVGNAGTLTVDLGARARGLTVTNLNTFSGMTGGVFQVVVSKVGSGAPALIGSSVAFNSPRGVAVNVRPGSPYFGRVYVANSAAGTKGDGLFIYGSDLSDTFGQAATAKNGGITNFATGTTASPMRVKVGHDDDMLYVTDWSDPSGNLYVTDPDITNSSATAYVLKKLTGSAAVPVGTANNHGSITGVETTGSLATGDLKIWTIDEDYQTDPTAPGITEANSLWQYNVGAGPLPWGNAPDTKLLTPSINFVSQTMDMARGTNGYFYVTELRSSGNEAGLFVVDGSGNLLFNSRNESVAEGFTVDQIPNCQGVAVSEDGKYVAVIQVNNVVTVIPLTNGVPNFPARFSSTGLLGTTGNGRGIAFDRADNVYIISSGLGILQSISLGFTATNTTSSAGTFTMDVPATEITATLLDPGSTVTNILSEADTGTFATFNIVRTNDALSGPLTVNFTLTGTATRGTQVTNDYYIRTNGVVITNATSVIIPTGSSNVLVDVVVNNDTTPELTETIVFALSGGAYNAVAPVGGTISIVDNDTNMVDISAVTFAQCFEGNTNDSVRFTLQRRGDTNAASYDVTIAYRGTAISNVDYVAITNVTIDPGVVTKAFDVHPIDDATIEVAETIIAYVTNGTSYLIGTNNALTTGATGTIIDDDGPAETVLFSDNFTTDTSANWTLRYASTNLDANDYTASFSFDYSSLGIPPAPHSAGDSLGLMLTVNKSGQFLGSGINLYPNGQSFSGNFALRFDMYIQQNGSAGTTEYSLFGINHDGAHTNWFRNSTVGFSGVPPGWTFDGIWAYVEADAAALGDYVLNSAPGTGTVFGPTALTSRLASTLTTVFHQPPWTSGGGAGAPGNSLTTTTPSWAQCELSQIGKIVTLKINNTVILTYSNATPFVSGNIMLGYDDAFDSVGSGGGGLAVFDNVRVVSLPAGIQITNVVQVGSNAQIDFTWFQNDPASVFKLQTASVVTGPYTDDANAATTYSVNAPAVSYRIVTPATNQPARFFRIRHQ